MPQPFVSKPLVHICVDAHRPDLERVKRTVADDPRYVFLNARVARVPIVVYTPNGFFPQSHDPPGRDFVISPDFILLDDPGPLKARRYQTIENPSVWAHFKRALEQVLPRAAYNGLRAVWSALRQAASRARHPGRERA